MPILSPRDFVAEFINGLVAQYYKSSDATLRDFGARNLQDIELGVAHIVELTYAASLATEEGRPARLTINWTPATSSPDVKIDEPIAASVKSLVKLSPICLEQQRTLRVCADLICGFDLSATAGDWRRDQARWSYSTKMLSRPSPIEIAVRGPGGIRLRAFTLMAELREGELRPLVSAARLPFVKAWLSQLTEELSEGALAAREVERRMIVTTQFAGILRKVIRGGHGGTIIVTGNQGEGVASKSTLHSHELNLALRRRSEFAPLLEEYAKNCAELTSSQLEAVCNVENDISAISDFIASLCNVDGAIVLTRQLEVVGFGGELAIADRADEVVFHDGPSIHSPSGTRALGDFGMRHRPAAAHAKRHPGDIVFVASADRSLSVFFSFGDGDVHHYRGLVALYDEESFIVGKEHALTAE